MRRSDEKTKCGKCGVDLPYDIIKYNDYSDYALSIEEYKMVDRKFATKVGLDFYCNDCYDSLDKILTSEIIDSSIEYINHDLQDAFDELKKDYEEKLNKLNELKQNILDLNSMIANKEFLNELDLEIIEKLNEFPSIYRPTYQDIEIGYPSFGKIAVGIYKILGE